MSAKSYSSWAEFEREEIRPNFKIGFSIDDLEEATFDRERFDDFEVDGIPERHEGDYRY
jgi:hypothetical protein